MAPCEPPSRAAFLANNVHTTDACGICLEPFSATHVPAVFSTQSSCRHVFGNECVQEWLTSTHENANTCPTCRRILFRRCVASEEGRRFGDLISEEGDSGMGELPEYNIPLDEDDSSDESNSEGEHHDGIDVPWGGEGYSSDEFDDYLSPRTMDSPSSPSPDPASGPLFDPTLEPSGRVSASRSPAAPSSDVPESEQDISRPSQS